MPGQPKREWAKGSVVRACDASRQKGNKLSVAGGKTEIPEPFQGSLDTYAESLGTPRSSVPDHRGTLYGAHLGLAEICKTHTQAKQEKSWKMLEIGLRDKKKIV